MEDVPEDSLSGLYSDEYFMKEAFREARKALEADEVPVGAIIVCNDRIVARAHNLTETLNDVTAHAEMQAITAAANDLGGKYLKDCTIYVTLEPCAMCAAAIGWAQMARLVYASGDEKKGYTLYSTKLLHPKTIVSSGTMEHECRMLLKDFFARKRK